MQRFVENHANAYLDIGIKAGDTIAVWFPESPEKHVELLAAAKIGAKVVDLDYGINNVNQVRDALRLAKARMIVFNPNKEGSGNENKLMLLRKAIPEFYYCTISLLSLF